MVQLFTTIFLTHQPNWLDVQALLATLLTPEEKRLVLEKARVVAQQRHPNGYVDELCPKANPSWDPNTWEGLHSLEMYQELTLAAVREAIPKQKNLSILYEVRQGPEEDPSSFYGRLCTVAKQWTDLDPESGENAKMFNTLFIGQSAKDIRKKLQKAEGAAGMGISQIIEIAYRIELNRVDSHWHGTGLIPSTLIKWSSISWKESNSLIYAVECRLRESAEYTEMCAQETPGGAASALQAFCSSRIQHLNVCSGVSRNVGKTDWLATSTVFPGTAASLQVMFQQHALKTPVHQKMRPEKVEDLQSLLQKTKC
ncbi:hypothetical protein Y1Q_0012503 [Alligator mississippiensis]|uniref:Core shell protein Gag P30 domain-containing protein n=1 Tax=Alligator mississippiensis TaxID=8496 RepID=A0A151M7Y7_ALLMI|nr:hypothetical protein Y1Q_0012503 [Alligator mississippiensis]